MQELKISKANALMAYREGDMSFKHGIMKLFPDVNFNPDIKELVTSYESACELEGIEPLRLLDFNFLPEKDREYHYYDHQMTVINRQLNQGWEPDYSNYSQMKYYPYFIWDENAAGGPGFSSFDYCFAVSRSAVGARRVYPSADLAIYAGKQFIHIHNKIHSLKSK